MTSSPQAMSLAFAGEGSRVRIVKAVDHPRTTHRLAELGLIPGVVLTVLRDNGGSLLLAIGDTRIVLGYALAHMLMVSPS